MPGTVERKFCQSSIAISMSFRSTVIIRACPTKVGQPLLIYISPLPFPAPGLRVRAPFPAHSRLRTLPRVEGPRERDRNISSIP